MFIFKPYLGGKLRNGIKLFGHESADYIPQTRRQEFDWFEGVGRKTIVRTSTKKVLY